MNPLIPDVHRIWPLSCSITLETEGTPAWTPTSSRFGMARAIREKEPLARERKIVERKREKERQQGVKNALKRCCTSVKTGAVCASACTNISPSLSSSNYRKTKKKATKVGGDVHLADQRAQPSVHVRAGTNVSKALIKRGRRLNSGIETIAPITYNEGLAASVSEFSGHPGLQEAEVWRAVAKISSPRAVQRVSAVWRRRAVQGQGRWATSLANQVIQGVL